jgi:hypothetical protein
MKTNQVCVVNVLIFFASASLLFFHQFLIALQVITLCFALALSFAFIAVALSFAFIALALSFAFSLLKFLLYVAGDHSLFRSRSLFRFYRSRMTFEVIFSLFSKGQMPQDAIIALALSFAFIALALSFAFIALALTFAFSLLKFLLYVAGDHSRCLLLSRSLALFRFLAC